MMKGKFTWPAKRYQSNFPPLPDHRYLSQQTFVGPTSESNWLVPGHMLVGAYPGYPDDEENDITLASILRCGVTTFVCLQQEYDNNPIHEWQWRSGQKLRPYIIDARMLIKTLPGTNFPKGRPKELHFIHCPIVDCSTVSDKEMIHLAKDLVDRMCNGEVLYVHCWGGHGRSGVVAALVLGIIYDLQPYEALWWVQALHDMRTATIQVPSPQTKEQKAQVARAIKKMKVIKAGNHSPTKISLNSVSGKESGEPPRNLSLQITPKNPENTAPTSTQGCDVATPQEIGKTTGVSFLSDEENTQQTRGPANATSTHGRSIATPQEIDGAEEVAFVPNEEKTRQGKHPASDCDEGVVQASAPYETTNISTEGVAESVSASDSCNTKPRPTDISIMEVAIPIPESLLASSPESFSPWHSTPSSAPMRFHSSKPNHSSSKGNSKFVFNFSGSELPEEGTESLRTTVVTSETVTATIQDESVSNANSHGKDTIVPIAPEDTRVLDSTQTNSGAAVTFSSVPAFIQDSGASLGTCATTVTTATPTPLQSVPTISLKCVNACYTGVPSAGSHGQQNAPLSPSRFATKKSTRPNGMNAKWKHKQPSKPTSTNLLRFPYIQQVKERSRKSGKPATVSSSGQVENSGIPGKAAWNKISIPSKGGGNDVPWTERNSRMNPASPKHTSASGSFTAREAANGISRRNNAGTYTGNSGNQVRTSNPLGLKMPTRPNTKGKFSTGPRKPAHFHGPRRIVPRHRGTAQRLSVAGAGASTPQDQNQAATPW